MSGRDLVEARRAMPSGGPQRALNILNLALVCLALVSVVALGWFGFGRYLATPPKAIVAVATVDSPWTADDEKRCKASARAAAKAARTEPRTALANPAIIDGFPPLATMLHCRLTTKASRFCNPAERTALVAMVQDYLGRLDILTAGLVLQGAPMQLVGGMFGGEAQAGSDIYDMQREGTFDFMKPYHDRIAGDLRDLARNGLISATDFGGFMGMGVPERVTKMLESVKVEASICP